MKISLVENELSGGKISKERIDDLLMYDCVSLKISGLHQDTFEYLINHYGNKIISIELFKCPKVVDFTPFESLSKIEDIEIWWNQKATDLWDFSKNISLKELYLTGIRKINKLDRLAESKTLKVLDVSNAVWSENIFESLEPLTLMGNLQILGFEGKLLDGRAEPITRIKKLEEVTLLPRQFSTEQFAWLRANLPSTVRSNILTPFLDGRSKKGYGSVLFVGKRKPEVFPFREPEKFEKYVQKYNALYEFYKNNQYETEPL